ncbi:MAG: glycosyltransferase [Flavobacteriaceae bacterium]|nr:glycosyltransferase [Flavobacteriaceae bacterium]
MKIVHITTSSHGGAGIAAFRLHEALRKLGISSAYISLTRTVDFEGMEIEDSILSYTKPSFLTRILRKLRSMLFPSEADKLTSKLQRIQGDLNCEIATLPFSKIPLEAHPLVKQADIVHLHWVSEILDYQRFFSGIKQPIVWTLHDMNPFKGIFHYQLDEERNKSARELDESVKLIKRNAIAGIRQGALITPSQWLLDLAKASTVFNHFAFQKTIANGINVKLYAEAERDVARQKLGLTISETVLLFTAALLNIERKGMQLMQEALENINCEITLLTLGKGSLQISNNNVKIIPLGYMTDQAEIANCYAAADVFLLPSLEDNLPNTMLESFSAGRPVIAFNTGGMKEHIQTAKNGILVPEMNSKALTKAIIEFCEDKYTFEADMIKAYANEHFNLEIQANKYLDLYRDLLTQEQPE